MDSFKNYCESVQAINDYSPTAIAAVEDFDCLIDSLDNEISILEEKTNQLNSAKSELESKINECENKIEETRLNIDELEKDLARIKSEMAGMNAYITISDFEGNSHSIPNVSYIILEEKGIAVEAKLTALRGELANLELYIGKCQAIYNELSSVLSTIDKRISSLINDIKTVENNKSEYNSTVNFLNEHSLLAYSTLTKIETSLDIYLGTRVRIVPAFGSADSNASFKKLSEIGYMSRKFKTMESRADESKRSSIKDVDNSKMEEIRKQDAAILRREKKGLKGLDPHVLGKYGEMKTDQDMRKKGFERISNGMIHDENDHLDKGIDGVYYRKFGIPQYVIVESKFGGSKLNEKTADGKQMSINWIINRLYDAVGKDMADIIREQILLNPNKVVCCIARVDNPSGNVTYSELNSKAEIIGKGIQL